MDFFSWISGKSSELGQWMVDNLPGSPITFIQTYSGVSDLLGFLNWFIPIGTLIAMAELWLTAIVIWYVVQWILRWANAIK